MSNTTLSLEYTNRCDECFKNQEKLDVIDEKHKEQILLMEEKIRLLFYLLLFLFFYFIFLYLEIKNYHERCGCFNEDEKVGTC